MINYRQFLSIICLMLIYSCNQLPKFFSSDPWESHYNHSEFDNQIEEFRSYYNDSTSQYVLTMIDFIKKSENEIDLYSKEKNKYGDLREKYELGFYKTQRIVKQVNNDKKYFDYLNEKGVRLKEKSFGNTLSKDDYYNWTIEVDKFLIEELILNELTKVWKCYYYSSELSRINQTYYLGINFFKFDGQCTYIGWESNQNIKNEGVKFYKRFKKFLSEKNIFKKYGFYVSVDLIDEFNYLDERYELSGIDLIFKPLKDKPIPSEEYWLNNYVK